MQEHIHLVDLWSPPVTADVYTSNAVGITLCRYWKDLNPADGVYDWTDFDIDIANIIAAGKKFGFRISAGGQSPDWVKALTGTMTFYEFVGASTTLTTFIIPIYYNPNYIIEWTKFITALSAHLQSDSGVWAALDVVSVTGINRKTGELRIPAQDGIIRGGVQSTFAPAMWLSYVDPYTEDKMMAVQQAIIDLFVTQFPGKDMIFPMLRYGGLSSIPPFPDIGTGRNLNIETMQKLLPYASRSYSLYTSVTSSYDGAHPDEITEEALSLGLYAGGQLNEDEFGDGTTSPTLLDDAMQQAKIAGMKFIEMHSESVKDPAHSYNSLIPQYNLLFSQQNNNTMSEVTATLLVDGVNGLLVVSDITDYAGLGLDPALAMGYIKFTGLSLYDNIGGSTPDIDNGVSNVNTSDIPLARNSDGSIKNGLYSLTYVVVYDEEITYEYTRLFEVDYESPQMCIELAIDCATSSFTCKDVTEYPIGCTLTSRVNTIQPPTASGLTNQVTSLATNTYVGITTGPWSCSIASNVTTIFSDGFSLNETLIGYKTPDGGVVTCDTSLCKILCCLAQLLQKEETVRVNYGVNNPEYISLNLKTTQISKLISMFYVAERCGDTTKSALYVTQIKEVSGCSENCNCSAGKILPIVATPGTSSNFTIDSPNNTVAVTSSVVGNLTTFHLEVAANLIASIKQYNVIQGVGCTVVPSVVGGVTTFTVNVSPVTPQRRFLGLFRIYRNPQNAIPGQAQYLYTLVLHEESGGLQVPGTIGLGQNTPNVLTDVIVLGLSDFYDTLPSSVPFAAQANIMRYTDVATISNPTAVKDVEAEVYNFIADPASVTIRLYNPIDGTPLTFIDITDKPDLYLQVSIQV